MTHGCAVTFWKALPWFCFCYLGRCSLCRLNPRVPDAGSQYMYWHMDLVGFFSTEGRWMGEHCEPKKASSCWKQAPDAQYGIHLGPDLCCNVLCRPAAPCGSCCMTTFCWTVRNISCGWCIWPPHPTADGFCCLDWSSQRNKASTFPSLSLIL